MWCIKCNLLQTWNISQRSNRKAGIPEGKKIAPGKSIWNLHCVYLIISNPLKSLSQIIYLFVILQTSLLVLSLGSRPPGFPSPSPHQSRGVSMPSSVPPPLPIIVCHSWEGFHCSDQGFTYIFLHSDRTHFNTSFLFNDDPVILPCVLWRDLWKFFKTKTWEIYWESGSGLELSEY